MRRHKRIFEIRPHAAQALLAEKTKTIVVRPARTGKANEYVVESDLDSVEEKKRIDNIVSRYAIDKGERTELGIETLHDCYNAIVKAVYEPKHSSALGYAATYAEYGLTLADADRREALNQASRTQALYVRTNLASWRGPTATAVRKRMDQIIGRS